MEVESNSSRRGAGSIPVEGISRSRLLDAKARVLGMKLVEGREQVKELSLLEAEVESLARQILPRELLVDSPELDGPRVVRSSLTARARVAQVIERLDGLLELQATQLQLAQLRTQEDKLPRVQLLSLPDPVKPLRDDTGEGPARFEGLEPFSVEFAMDLVPWVLGRHDELEDRLSRVRQTLFRDTGVKLRAISLRDRSDLSSSTYRLLLRGEEVAFGRLKGLDHLALEAKDDGLEGTPGVEPAFGMPGLWIAPELRDVARSRGRTVLGPLDMFLTHVGEILHHRAHELFGGAQLSEELLAAAERMPGLVRSLRKSRPGVGPILRVMRNLLEEGLSIRDLDSIFDALLEHGAQTRDPEQLTVFVRRALRRHISRRFSDDDGRMHALVLEAKLECSLVDLVEEQGLTALPAELRVPFQRGLQNHLERWSSASPLVLICHDRLRRMLRATLGSAYRVLPVVAVSEVVSDVQVRLEGEVSLARSLDLA